MRWGNNMKKYGIRKGLDLFQWIVNVSTIVALILQCLKIPAPWEKYIPAVAYLVIFLSLLSIFINITTRKRNILKRSRLIALTKDRMINATGKL